MLGEGTESFCSRGVPSSRTSQENVKKTRSSVCFGGSKDEFFTHHQDFIHILSNMVPLYVIKVGVQGERGGKQKLGNTVLFSER